MIFSVTGLRLGSESDSVRDRMPGTLPVLHHGKSLTELHEAVNFRFANSLTTWS